MSGVVTVPSEVRVAAGGLELRDATADGRYLEARACRFNQWVDVGPFYEQHDPGVFDGTLARHADDVPLVMGHTADAVVARSVKWLKSDADLVGVFRFGSHAEARDAVTRVEERMLTSVSVGFLPGKRPGDNEWTVDEHGVPHVRRNRARLVHLGLVVSPADDEASVLALRSLGAPGDVLPLATPRADMARRILEQVRSVR